jgi:hypothetical protein
MIKVVLSTNAIISAALSPSGNCSRIIERIYRGNTSGDLVFGQVFFCWGQYKWLERFAKRNVRSEN